MSISTHYMILCFTFVALSSPVSASDCNDDWEDASDVGLGYLWFETSETMTYGSAVTFCENRNSKLIEIDSYKQMSYIVHKLRTASSDWWTSAWGTLWWGGATDRAQEGAWRWTQSGAAVQNFVWRVGEPNNKGGYEDYFCFFKSYHDYDGSEDSFFGNDCSYSSEGYPLCQQKM